LTKALLQVYLERADTQVADRTLQIAQGDFCITSAAAMIRFLKFFLKMGCNCLKSKQFWKLLWKREGKPKQKPPKETPNS